MLRLQDRSSGIELLKAGQDLIVAGYASVELVDKQGDLITKAALKDAFKKFMQKPKYRNVQLAHSNIQIGEVIPNYTDNEGRLWKSEVDDAGMFVVVQLRGDIEKAREVASEIRKGNLAGFSIGGQAFKRVRKSDGTHGSYQEISKLELHEITICEKGINPEATFNILKQDKTKEMKKMTDDVMEQMSDVLARLEGRLDSMEKGDLPPFMEEKKNDSDDKEAKDEKKDKDDDNGDDKKDDTEKSQYSDVITSEYLDWMENTLKSAGVDTGAARTHFDGVAKANLGSTPESIGDGADYFAAQVKGRAQESGNPSTNAISRAGLSGKGGVKKSQFLHPTNVESSRVEAAYEVFKAAKEEQLFKQGLEQQFEGRFSDERTATINRAQADAFDARGPLQDINKSITALSERIDNIGTTSSGELITKSASKVDVPSTEDLANMSWEEVHQLAGGLFRED